jgi:hypothetical protein
MLIGGIDTGAIGDQFGGYTPGRMLILDADGPAYVAAATAKTLPTALRKFQTIVLSQMFLTNSERAELHLTANTSTKAGRFNILAAKPYQGNRDGKAKPPLLEAVRQAAAHESNWLPQYEVIMHHKYEADDGMIMSAYLQGDNGVIWSEDKDLRMTPHPYWERKTNTLIRPQGFGSLYIEYTPAGQAKCLGYGRKFFWAQMLMGDTADNIAGCTKVNGKLCGPKGAFEYLDKYDDESAGANAVIDAYRENKQNPIPEGWLLWLLRNPQDTFWIYLNELQWSLANRVFLDDCVRRVWFKQPEVKEDEFEDVPY